MEITSWITLAAVVVALGIGLSSLVQTQRLQRRERKERLLNEIIECARDLANVAFGREVTTVPTEEQVRENLISLGNKIFRYQAIDPRSLYIMECARAFGDDLYTAVLALISCRNDVGKNIDKCMENFEDKANIESLKKSEHELRKHALELIELVAKIKTKNIG